MNFELLREFVDALNASNSTLAKKATLSDGRYNDRFLKDVMVATYNPFVKYYVTSANLIKNSELSNPQGLHLFELLDKLSSREVTGHDALALVNGFISEHKDYEDIIHNILDRNLKTRVTESIINKVHKKLIPAFDVVLAKTFEDHMKKVNFVNQIWYASRKLDGLRCVVTVHYDGTVEIKSRKGMPFNTLDLIKAEVQKLGLKGVVFDGEICIVDEDGNEDFAAIQKLWNKKNFTIPNPRYKIFDMLTLEEFKEKEGERNLSVRIAELSETIPANNTFLSVLEFERVLSDEHLEELREKARKLGWEGIMIRKNEGYKGKRTDSLLKCKLFYDAEYVVISTINKVQRVIVDQVEVEEDMLSKVVIKHKGYEVGVGSGFSIDQRRLYYAHPEKIIGKEITVQYFEETTNEKGTISLRFPTVKAIWEEGKRNV